MGYFHFIHSSDCLLTVCQTLFDVGQATLLQEHTQALSVRQAIAQSRKSRGLLDTILRRDPPPFKPTYDYRPDGSACRIFGTVTVKKVTGNTFVLLISYICSLCPLQANLHVTTLGHGYTSHQHVDHNRLSNSPISRQENADHIRSDEFVTRNHRIFLWPILPGHRTAVGQFL